MDTPTGGLPAGGARRKPAQNIKAAKRSSNWHAANKKSLEDAKRLLEEANEKIEGFRKCTKLADIAGTLKDVLPPELREAFDKWFTEEFFEPWMSPGAEEPVSMLTGKRYTVSEVELEKFPRWDAVKEAFKAKVHEFLELHVPNFDPDDWDIRGYACLGCLAIHVNHRQFLHIDLKHGDFQVGLLSADYPRLH